MADDDLTDDLTNDGLTDTCFSIVKAAAGRFAGDVWICIGWMIWYFKWLMVMLGTAMVVTKMVTLLSDGKHDYWLLLTALMVTLLAYARGYYWLMVITTVLLA